MDEAATSEHAAEQKKTKTEEPKRPQQDGKEKQESENRPVWPFLLAGLIAAAFSAAVLYYIFRPRPDVWTDDAYVRVHYAAIAPRISGQVATVPVEDNQEVNAGEVLATLDPRDYETAVAGAEAALARDQARLSEIAATLARQPALIEEQRAGLAAASAKLALSRANAQRYGNLAATGAGTVQQHQDAESTLHQDQAAVDSAKASVDAAVKELDVQKAQKSAAEANVKSDQAQLDRAKLELSYTRILSPLDGMVGERSVEVGNYVGPGTTLMTVVPLDRVYIEANYREVDLVHVRSGQPATIHVDAYDIDLKGKVDSVPPASGASFSPIPPNNATGNFTKIVQRLPVKIVLTPGQPLAKLLRVGFSVETTIHTGLENVVDEQMRSRQRVTRH
ncbi:MAG TPA: HlyD family secretion protein [Methylovirgula sp.]|nr:HlyD family secretion protein [Methylovirgula sp.]